MKILLVNDDGVSASGIKVLAEKLCPFAEELIIVAPNGEKSAVSHGLTIRKGMAFTKLVPLVPQIDTYALDGTPADCVKVAFKGLEYDFDIVCSGINHGLNLGSDIAYSGTVAGASEAALCGKKGIAFSAERDDIASLDYFAIIMNYILDNQLLLDADILNVNIPRSPKGIRLTVQGGNPFTARYEITEDGLYQLKGEKIETFETVNDTDTYWFYQGYVTITPLTVNKTDYSFFAKHSF